ncbi:MAG: beta-galactosidase [Haliscomenobacter sp.]|nr:beta-galactosidase [Haliscomenobacter sp.]MBK8657039.1 beta-galactosidase [Haliscomenobacter sp.]MBP9874428.1 beta-galactosidase [Haliscomenobacter sp.]
MKFVLTIHLVWGMALSLLAQRAIIPADSLITVGTYYYPEQWAPEDWESDIKKIAALGFEFTHYGEFAWAAMEPKEGTYDFSWLDKAVNLAQQHGLKVIMCTPTPTPPRWLTAKHPDILIKNAEGRVIQHGARTHPSWSSDVYKGYVEKIVTQLGKRYGNHPAIIGWQLDNEPSHYGSPYDYSENAEKKFQLWLQKKYQTIEKLNATWGAAFWSLTYQHFSQIQIPNGKELVAQPNPHAILDFKRFTSDEASGFLSFQARILRKHIAPSQWITSNFMPFYESVDPGKSADLDFVTYTKYLVAGYDKGIGEQGFRLGSPEQIGLASDYFRPVKGITGVMELQPGQVNWGVFNPQPLPGAVYMWLWHAFAAGSDLACNYRFLSPETGGEQYHTAMLEKDRQTISSGGKQYVRFLDEIRQLRKSGASETMPADVKARKSAIVYSLDNRFEQDNQPQTDRWNYMNHLTKYYNALVRLNAPVDILREEHPLDDYAVVVVPAFQLLDKGAVDKWTQYAASGGNLVISCRTGQKDREARFWRALWAEPIYPLIGGKVDFYDHLPPGLEGKVQSDGQTFSWNSWGEILIPGPETETWAVHANQYYQGSPTVIHRRLGKGSVTYVGTDSRQGDLEYAIIQKLCQTRNIPVWNLPYGVVFNWRKGYWVGVNYSEQPYRHPVEDNRILFGKKEIQPGGVLVYK